MVFLSKALCSRAPLAHVREKGLCLSLRGGHIPLTRRPKALCTEELDERPRCHDWLLGGMKREEHFSDSAEGPPTPCCPPRLWSNSALRDRQGPGVVQRCFTGMGLPLTVGAGGQRGGLPSPGCSRGTERHPARNLWTL